jgi:hypothetical protein
MAGNRHHDGFRGLDASALNILSFDDSAWRFGAIRRRFFHKRTWHRDAGTQQNVARELDFESEFFVYLNLASPAGSVRSYILRVLAENRNRLVFFLGLRLRFQKYDNAEDYVHIWISSRTMFPYDGRISLPDEQLRYCDDLLNEFWGCAVSQANSFEGRGSGWTFRSIAQFDVRYTEARNTGAIRYGAGSYISCKNAIPLGLRNKLRWNFEKGLIVDPDAVFPNAGSCLCVLKSVSLRMALSCKGTTLCKMKKYGREKLWNFLKTALKPTSVDWVDLAMQGGIPASDFESLEQANLFSSRKLENAEDFRLLKRMYPAVVDAYKGFAVNLYAPLEGGGRAEVYLYPLVCSKNCNDLEYLQVDLLKDAAELYLSPPRARQNNQLFSNKSPLGHCFLMTDLSEALQGNVGSRQRSRLKKRQQLCRRCLRNFEKNCFQDHVAKCNPSPSASGNRLFRPSRNRFRHEPLIRDSATGLQRRNELGFEGGQLHKCLKPLYIAAVDFEAANVSVDAASTAAPRRPTGQPKDSIFKQTALAWGLAYRSLYTHLPLPKELKSVRMGFLKDDAAAVGGDTSCRPSRRRGVLTNQEELILTLFQAIREDAYLIADYLTDVFVNKTVPLRPFAELSNAEKEAYHAKRNCDICKLKFGGKFLANDGVTLRTRYKVRDHDHLQFGGTTERFLLCQTCNLNLQNGVESTRWLAYRYFMHNGSKYDFTILLRAIANLCDVTFWQYSDPSCRVLKETRLFRKRPKIFFASETSVLAISLFFNCSRLSSCPFCSLTRKEIDDLRASGRQIRRCALG